MSKKSNMKPSNSPNSGQPRHNKPSQKKPAQKKRVPQLKFTKLRNIGWHVSFRDPQTGMPKKHRFKGTSEEEVLPQYYQWVAEFLQGSLPAQNVTSQPSQQQQSIVQPQVELLSEIEADIVSGSLLHVTSGLLRFEESRVRPEGERRSKGTISKQLYLERKSLCKEFMNYVNSRHGADAVCRMQIADLSMEDVEEYNRRLARAGYSASQMTKRMGLVKWIIDRAGRPEFGGQQLSWNWDSLDILRGKPSKGRTLPTLEQLKLVLSECSVRQTAMIWLAIGCGFGQRDLSALRVQHIDQESYDLRRGKTGVERFGQTPKLVWTCVERYLQSVERKAEDLMFLTRQGKPLVHRDTDSTVSWWSRLRKRLGEPCKDLDGFYVLRHLGATEFGSRPGCSVGAMKAWLGHSASSQMADVYMRPVAPEHKAIVEWVRKSLQSDSVDLKDLSAKQ